MNEAVVHTFAVDERLERVLREKLTSEKARHDKLTSTLTSSLTGAVKNKLDHLVKAEMKNLVLPGESL